MATKDPAERFFAELAAREHEPLLRKATGSTRFDVVDGAANASLARDGRHGRHLRDRKGTGEATCVIRVDKAVFDKIVTGRLNAVAAVLRGDLRGRRGLAAARAHAAAVPGTAPEGESVNDGLVKILDGNTFVVSDERGDIEASLTDPTGLFSFDTRFLSRWVLTVNGERLNPLSVDDLEYFRTRFFLVPGTGTVYIDAKLSVIRQRAVSNGFHEELTILNHADKAVSLRFGSTRVATSRTSSR